MGEPWGLSGPHFLLVLVVLAAVSLAPYAWARLAHRQASRISVPVDPHLDLYERAYLVAGPGRTAVTALVAMSEAERVRVLDDGRVDPVEGTDAPRNPVERALVSYVRSSPLMPASRVVTAVEQAPEVRALAPALERSGLLLDAQQRRRHRRLLLPLAAVLALGGVRLVNGLLLGRPVAFLVVLLVAAAVLLLVLARSVPRRSPMGDALARQWSQEQTALRSPEPAGAGGSGGALTVGLGVGLAGGVAVLGLSALEDDPMLLALRSGGVTPGASGDGGGDGGGGCGGGCGGCGG